MDVFIISFSYIIATAIRFNFEFLYPQPSLFKYHLLVVCITKALCFYFLETNVGIVRHTNFDDAKQIFKASALSTGLLLLISNLKQFPGSAYINIPTSILTIDFFVSVFGLVASRVLVKNLFESLSDTFKSNKRIVIYGAGRLGMMTKNALSSSDNNQYKILFFIDENKQKIGKSIEGIKVYGREEAKEILKGIRLENVEVVFAITDISSIRKTEITEELLEIGVPVRAVPPVEKWMNGELKASQLSNIKIEDLLERPSIQINNRLVGSFIENKIIMITGAAGSIGSEIVRQLLKFKPQKLILLDQAESALYDLETEIFRLRGLEKLKTIVSVEVCNVSNQRELERFFIRYAPQVIFHAAAYKHVPLMEENPFKAMEVNALGTKGLADLAVKYEVEKFVFVSTDKAVNPTNVMGASKRLAEMYVQSLSMNSNISTRFVTTRFGNVLGSNGSVIPLFRKQIERGGPVTVTHPDIIRYFMTIPEACQLVLEAGTMGKGGEIFVFDMGVPVKILDLAKKMIKLSGYEPYTQIPIEFTGLRHGEKLYEELLGDKESTLPTHHPKIMAANNKPQDFKTINAKLTETKANLYFYSSKDIVSLIKGLVPEFISNNSPFEALDKRLPSSTDTKVNA